MNVARVILVSCVALSAGAGCTIPTRTTRLHAADLQDIAHEVAASLGSSDFLQERGPESEPIVIALHKVENLTSDLLNEGEKWYLMDRVLNSETMGALRRERNIRFVIPRERLDELTARTEWAGAIGEGRRPTHTMTAVLRSVTRSASADRTELYAAQYRLTALQTGETVWAGEYLLKRAASGRSYN